MNLLNIEQHSHEWYQARLGNLTGSRIREALSTLSRASGGYNAGDPSKESRDYMMELALQRLTGIVPDHHVTPAMEWGIEHERHAVAAYEVVTGNDCRKVGIASHPRIERFMASPDRYVGQVGVLEVKCPTSIVHLSYLRGGVIPAEYVPQCLSELACDPSREWLDFMSFDPRFPPLLQTFIKRMYRSEVAMQIAEQEDKARKFLSNTEKLTAELKELAETRKF